jgi:hypothetical protein
MKENFNEEVVLGDKNFLLTCQVDSGVNKEARDLRTPHIFYPREMVSQSRFNGNSFKKTLVEQHVIFLLVQLKDRFS